MSLFSSIIAFGDLAGQEPYHAFGYNSAVGTGWETVFASGSTAVIPDKEQKIIMYSTSDQDDQGASDTGAHYVKLYGINGTYGTRTEELKTRGTLNRTSDKDYLWIYRAEVTKQDIGDAGVNVGDITIENKPDNNPMLVIRAGDGSSTNSLLVVEKGFEVALQQVHLHAVPPTTPATIDVRLRCYDHKDELWNTLGTWSFAQDVRHDFAVPLLLVPKKLYEFQAKSSVANTAVSWAAVGIKKANPE